VFKNVYDSEVLMGQLRASEKTLQARTEEGNIIVINTCGFIDNAKSGIRKYDSGICR
jgi:ribosomal protein S12 methylthiotransferase